MSTALLLAADSSDSSDDGSYVAHDESESDDEIEEPAAPEHARSAAELIAALEDAPDEEIRAMMREARPLRSPPALPQDLLAAFKRRTSDLRVLRLGAAITYGPCRRYSPARWRLQSSVSSSSTSTSSCCPCTPAR